MTHVHTPYDACLTATVDAASPERPAATVHNPYFAPAAAVRAPHPESLQNLNLPSGGNHSHHNNGSGSRRPMPVCLDHLKGVCHLKRLRCKYSHPATQRGSLAAQNRAVDFPEEGDNHNNTQRPVCEVFQLTGFCKFGASCRDAHPPQLAASSTDNYNNTTIDSPNTGAHFACTPATTTRMTEACREEASHLAFAAGRRFQEEALQRVEALLNTLHDANINSAVDLAAEAASGPHPVHPAQLPTLCFARGAATSEEAQQGSVARFAGLLAQRLSPHAAQRFREALEAPALACLRASPDLLTVAAGDPTLTTTLTTRCLGVAALLGNLYRFGAVGAGPVNEAVAHHLALAFKHDTPLARLALLALCRLFLTAGESLARLEPLQFAQYLHRFRAAAARHPRGGEARAEADRTLAVLDFHGCCDTRPSTPTSSGGSISSEGRDDDSDSLPSSPSDDLPSTPDSE